MRPYPQTKKWFVPSQLGQLGETNYKELVPVAGPPEEVLPLPLPT